MAGYQFLRLEKYARAARATLRCKNGKVRAGKPSLRAVLAEASREPAHCPHIRNPQPPVVIFGVHPDEVFRLIQDGATRVKDPKGRKVKRTTALLLAGVVSYPIRLEDVVRDPKAQDDFDQWGKHVLKFLRDEFGVRLRSVVKHVDEEYLHFHFYVIPNFNVGESNLVQAHPGMLAAAGAVPSGYKGRDAAKLKNDAYKNAMREFLDRYYEVVSMPFGHARRGPGKRRLTRAQWRAEQQQSETLKKTRDEADLLRQAIKSAGQAEIAEMKRQAEIEINQDRDKARSLKTELMKWIATLKELGRTVPNEVGEVIKDPEGTSGPDFSQNP